ncbi:sialic acid-binding Ig-like lectin 13 [Scyliorhinus torazame]|uniref:sialic acid-binding Ig-like lectin 13 n=1 Tax=Scyliorhinus torazame TaxID=75743 RepID=UPI003B5C4DBA
MIGKSYLLLTLLRVGLSQEWKGNTPGEVTAQEGLCAQIPCHYSYPSHLANQLQLGIWYNNDEWGTWSIIFHSKDQIHELPQFRNRTQLSGDLKDGDCSLIINNIRRQDAGPYFFRIELDNWNSYSYLPPTQLHIYDFTDKPRISPAEIIAGKRVDISCTFNTTCNGTAPVLTWDTPTDVPGSVSNTVTQHGVTLTYTSVLSLTPSLKHHGQNLTCRVRYPSVTSERTLVLTVQYPPQETMVSISRSTDGIREGSNITLTCSSESVPPISHYTWFRIEGNTSTQLNTSSRTLSFNPVTRENDASFYCTVRNPLGNSTSNITHLDVQYNPEISQELECTRRSEGVTCICVANSNPPGDLTWHLPPAKISGNQTRGRLLSRRVRDGHLVIGSLILTGPQDEKGVMVSCSVRNTHGEAMFKVYLWVRGRGSRKWPVGSLMAGIMLSVFVAGILIFVNVKNTGDESRCTCFHSLFHGHSYKPDDPLCTKMNFSKLPSGDGTVRTSEDTEYTGISRFQRN